MGGSETETTLKRNRAAIDSIAFRPRVLRDVSKVDVSSSFLGRPVRIPVMLAPVGSVESFTTGGGATAGKASGAFGVPHMLSSACNPGLEATAAAADNYRIFQLYVRGDDAFVDDHVKRARDHATTPLHDGERPATAGASGPEAASPWRVRATGQEYQAALSWDSGQALQDRTTSP